MKNLLYDFYGIYVERMDGDHFVYQQKHFYIRECLLSETELLSIYSKYVSGFIRCQSTHYLHLIKNRYGHMISAGKVLFCFYDSQIRLDDLLMHSLIDTGNSRYEEVLTRWVKQMDIIENRALPAIMGQSKQFEYLYALCVYYLGMAESALAYLQDYFNPKAPYKTSFQFNYTHVQNQIEWVDPFKYKQQHYLNLMTYLYRDSYLTIEHLTYYLHHIPPQDLIYMYSYLLYPEEFFNEIFYYIDHPETAPHFIHYYRHIEIYEKRVHDFYDFISQYVKVRPIEWF